MSREPPDQTSRPESPAIARSPDQRGCNGKSLSPPSQPHEYGPGIRPKDATDKEARAPRSRGRSVRRVVQQRQNASVLEQGCAGLSQSSANRCDQFTRHPGRTSSPLRRRLSCRYTQGSIALFWPCANHFRSSPTSGRFRRPSPCLKGAKIGASLLIASSPLFINRGPA
jgi:hypothetical protein